MSLFGDNFGVLRLMDDVRFCLRFSIFGKRDVHPQMEVRIFSITPRTPDMINESNDPTDVTEMTEHYRSHAQLAFSHTAPDDADTDSCS